MNKCLNDAMLIYMNLNTGQNFYTQIALLINYYEKFTIINVCCYPLNVISQGLIHCGTKCQYSLVIVCLVYQPFDRAFIDNPGPMVVFATPGMLHAGLSLQIFKKWAPNELNMVCSLIRINNLNFIQYIGFYKSMFLQFYYCNQVELFLPLF